MTFIVPTSAAEHIARKLDADVLYLGENKDGKRYFPDGEIYTRILDFDKTDRVMILHSGQPKPNEGLIELENVLNILKDKKKELFFLYFPYGMQDNEFEKGETNVAQNLIKKYTMYYGVEKIYTIDAHFWGRNWAKNYPIENFSAVSLLKKKSEEKYGEMVYITPDIGAQRRTGIGGTKKKRKNSYTIEITSTEDLEKMIKGKNVGVVDDLVETGGTMCRAYDFCKDNGAKKVLALITHGVLPEGISRIKEKYDDLFLTNTINRPEANVDISGLVKVL